MRISFAANHGDIGGGEVMLLALADGARDLGHEIEVVTPASPSALKDAALDAEHRVITIDADGTAGYLMGLRRWSRMARTGLLWCNGLRPALATAGQTNRVVHLHQKPSAKLAPLAKVASVGAKRVVVPSEWMNEQLGGRATVLPNWTADLPRRSTPLSFDAPVRLGFLGRLTSDKGARALAHAVESLNAEDPGRYEVVVGGESRFTDEGDAQTIQTALLNLEPPATFLGWVAREDFFRLIDLAVFPSVFPESFGLVAAEAMAAGCPFVISDAGALPEVTAHDPRFTARAGDSASLDDAIRAAVEHYTPGTVTRARERWQANFSPEAGKQRLAELLAGLEVPR